MANPQNLKPFKPGDKRINRDGRPRNGGELAALVRRVGHEIATDKSGNPVIGPDGRPMTVIEVIIRQRAQDKKYQGEFVERGWGKVPTPVTLQGDDEGGPVVLKIEYVNKRTDNNPTDAT